MFTRKWLTTLTIFVLIAVLVSACAPAATPIPTPAPLPKSVEPTKASVPAVPAPATMVTPTPTPKLAGSGKISDPFMVDYKDLNVAAVNFVFVAAMQSEITATQASLVNPVFYNMGGRLVAVGEVPGVPGYKAAALATFTQQSNADQVLTRLPYHFPPAKGGKYDLVTLGGIAGGFYYQWVPGAPSLQPGDSLAAAGSCNVTFNTYQPALTQGYQVVKAGDTFDSLALALTGDKSRGQELYDYNANRMRYKSPADLKAGHVLLTPLTWPANTVTSFGLPRNVSLAFGGKSYSLPAQNPCIHLSAAALVIRDEAVSRMGPQTLPADVIAYRQRNFTDARTSPTVYSGNWYEGGGHGWFGDPWIARHLETVFSSSKAVVVMSDMETYFHHAAVLDWVNYIVKVASGTTIDRLETDNVFVYRTSSDPPDKYRGAAFAIADFVKDPAGTGAKVQSAYNGDGTPDSIPFGSLIASQSDQFKTFNFTVARVQVAKQNTAISLPAVGEYTTKPSVAAPVPTTVPVKELIFGLVLVGPYNDHGWSEAHYVAAQYVEKNLPGAKMIYLDKVNPADRKGVTLDSVVADMKSKGAKIIFTTSDDFAQDTRTAAAKYPELTFINISGDDALTGKGTKNLGNYMGKMEYGKMIAGCAAALTTQTGKIAYLGPIINDETRRLASSAYLGAQYCWTHYRGKLAAELKFDVKWIGFWFNIPGVTLDPTKVTNDFIAAGADVILSGIDTTEALVVTGQQAKQGKKVYAIPYDFKGACNEAPQICLGVPYFNWGPGYLKILKAFSAGTWKSEWTWDGPDWKNINNPETSAVGFINGPALADYVKTDVDKFMAGLANGSIDLFKGPLNFQDGSVYLKDGEKAVWEKNVWYFPQLLQGMTGPSK